MPKELPLPLKDIEYKIIGRSRNVTKEMPNKIKKLRVEFEREWHHLKNAMALIYDKVYSKRELDMKGMRTRVKELHNKLDRAGWAVTDLQIKQSWWRRWLQKLKV
jgi:hypothetical protein